MILKLLPIGEAEVTCQACDRGLGRVVFEVTNQRLCTREGVSTLATAEVVLDTARLPLVLLTPNLGNPGKTVAREISHESQLAETCG